MNDIHLALKAAQDAVGVGLEADTDERIEIRSGIRNGRRRRTTGAVLASVAALAIVSVGAVTLTRGAPDPTAPAGFDVPSPAPSPSTSAPEAVIDRVYDDYDGPVEVSLAGGGTVAFTASTESKAATVMSEDPTAGPTLAPVDPELLAQVTDGWALIEATEQTEDDHFGHVSSHLFLASPEGRSVEIADLDALADELGISGSRFIEDVAFDPVDDRALLGFHDPDGRYVLLLWALESGETTVLASHTDVESLYYPGTDEGWKAISWHALAWDGERWLVWTAAVDAPVTIAIAPDGSSWSTDGLWIDDYEDMIDTENMILEEDDSDLPGTPSAYSGGTLWLGGAEEAGIGWFSVNRDNSLTQLCAPDWEVRCRVIGTSGDSTVVLEGKQALLVDLATGERTEMPGVSPLASLGGSSMTLGDGYLELPYSEGDATTAIWHRPGQDVEVDVPSGRSYGVASDGDGVDAAAWIAAGWPAGDVGVVGLDGVYRHVDVGLDIDGEWNDVRVILIG